MYNLDQKRQRIENLVKVALVLGVAFIVGPFIVAIVKGVIGLAIAFAVSYFGVQFAPVFGVKVANWRLKALKAEAAKNPIETLERSLQNRTEALGSFRDTIRNSSAELAQFKDKLAGFKKTYPQDAAKFDEQVSQMEQLLKHRVKRYEDAREGIEQFRVEIEKARAIWNMAQAAAAMNKAAGVDVDQFFMKIQTDTAIDSVQKSLNSAIADLELSLSDEKQAAPKQITDATVRTVDVKSTKNETSSAGLALDL